MHNQLFIKDVMDIMQTMKHCDKIIHEYYLV